MTEETPQPTEPHIRILKGKPTDEELAALIVALGSVGGAPAARATREHPLGASGRPAALRDL